MVNESRVLSVIGLKQLQLREEPKRWMHSRSRRTQMEEFMHGIGHGVFYSRARAVGDSVRPLPPSPRRLVY